MGKWHDKGEKNYPDKYKPPRTSIWDHAEDQVLGTHNEDRVRKDREQYDKGWKNAKKQRS